MRKYLYNLYKECIGDEIDEIREWEKIISSIEKKGKITFPQTPRPLFSLIKYAVVLLLGIGCTWMGMRLFSIESTPITGICKVTTSKGEKSLMELPDGTRVWLNSCSTLSYFPSDYGKKGRDIRLDGEAYFEVAKDADHPFIVETNGINITALGTTFNISAYSDDDELTTTLFSGKVAVQPNLTKQQILLAPNQIAIYYKSKNKIEKKNYDEHSYTHWRNGYLSFDMMQLQDITKLLERNFDVAFLYRNQNIRELQFTGSFHNNESLDDILQVIKTNINIHYTRTNDTIYIQ